MNNFTMIFHFHKTALTSVCEGSTTFLHGNDRTMLHKLYCVPEKKSTNLWRTVVLKLKQIWNKVFVVINLTVFISFVMFVGSINKIQSLFFFFFVFCFVLFFFL